MSQHASASGRSPNRLAGETSPYLLQHAHNPVDWHPWGEAALALARAQDKPVFLSVGYSACHWCHVMERESFENEEIARFLNEHYVSIKVDREERPDVDQIYMSAVQLITRRGGWPMSVFLTPEGKPFYGGTYWPPQSKFGIPGFQDILLKLHDYWVNKREEVDASAERLVEAIQDLAAPIFEQADLSEETLRLGMQELLSSADRAEGGFGGAPKFPHPMDIRVLLRGSKRFGEQRALDAACLTLTKMARGGIYDHLGGGFHRYSTDAGWLVPHFEKMLYDNALLVPAYLEAWQIAHDPLYEQVAREALDYVLREMTSPEGGFYSTQDADSEGVEGKFFVWTTAETQTLLGPDAETFNSCYDVTPRGNWEGHSILHRIRSTEEDAARLGLPAAELELLLQRCREKLFAARRERIAPGRDDKILASWNGLMISALALGANVLGEPRYRDAAARAAEFILLHMRDERGRLLHSCKDGRARFAAYLDDYACLIDGLVELFQATADESLLTAALELSEDVLRRFGDPELGGCFYTADDHEELIARTKDSQDNAVPSGNGMLATALLKLARLTSRDDLEEAGMAALNALGGLLAEHPRAAGQSLLALDFALGPAQELIILDAGDDLAKELGTAVWERFLPNKVACSWPVQQAPQVLGGLLEGKREEVRSGLFICEHGACRLPVHSQAEAEEQLSAL